MQMTKFFITAAALVIAGLLLFAAVFLASGRDISKLFAGKDFETETQEITDPFHDISISVRTADLTLLPAEDGQCRIIFFQDPDRPHSASVENGILTITDASSDRDLISVFSEGWPAITVYLPETQYGRIAADMTTGDLLLKDLSADTVALTVTTGDITCNGLRCSGDLLSRGTTGDLTLRSTIASGRYELIRTTGDIQLEGCDAGEIFAKTTTGDITGSLLSDKIFSADTTTGSVDVPTTTSGGNCELFCTTGDIIFVILPQ